MNEPNEKNGPTRALTTVGRALLTTKKLPFYYLLVWVASLPLALHYQNDFCLLAAAVTGYCVMMIESVRRRRGDAVSRAFYLTGFGLPTALLLIANFILMDLGFARGRAAIIEGLNGGLSAKTKNFQPVLFVPGLYKLTYYNLDQSLVSDCQDRIQTADGQHFSAKVILPLQLSREPEVLLRMHQIIGGDDNLEALIEKIVCSEGAKIVASAPNSLAFGPAIRVVSKEVYQQLILDRVLSMIGVERQGYLLIRNQMFRDF